MVGDLRGSQNKFILQNATEIIFMMNSTNMLSGLTYIFIDTKCRVNFLSMLKLAWLQKNIIAYSTE